MKEISQKDLFSDWANKKIKNVYYFVGEETAIKKAAVKKLKEIIKPDTFNFAEYDMPKADISDVLSQANTTGVFSDLRMVILNGVEKAVADEIIKYGKVRPLRIDFQVVNITLAIFIFNFI